MDEPYAANSAKRLRSDNAQPRLTLRERLFCHYFHYDTWVRTPDLAAEKDAALGPFDNDAFLDWYGKEQNLDAHDMAIARDFLHDPDKEKVTDHDSHVMAIASPPAPGLNEYLTVMGLRIFRVERARQSLVNLFERGRVVRDGELAMWEVRWWPAYEGTIGGMPAVDRAVSARAAVAVDR